MTYADAASMRTAAPARVCIVGHAVGNAFGNASQLYFMA